MAFASGKISKCFIFLATTLLCKQSYRCFKPVKGIFSLFLLLYSLNLIGVQEQQCDGVYFFKQCDSLWTS